MWLFRRKVSLGKSRYLTNNGQRPRVTTHPPIERTDHIKKCSLPNQQRETCDSFVNLSFSELACCVRSRKLDESLERFSIFCFSAFHISPSRASLLLFVLYNISTCFDNAKRIYASNHSSLLKLL